MAMMGLMEKVPFPVDEVNESKKYCVDCKTTKTPLWRGGPAGPKSLCNACGIRYRKRRISMVGMGRGSEKKRERTNSPETTATTTTTTTSTAATSSNAKSDESDGRDLGQSLKMRIMALGKDIMLQRSPSVVKKQRCQRRRKLGEEEQAAVSLMALSCGSVFA